MNLPKALMTGVAALLLAASALSEEANVNYKLYEYEGEKFEVFEPQDGRIAVKGKEPVASRKNLFERVFVASLKIYPKEIAQMVVKSTSQRSGKVLLNTRSLEPEKDFHIQPASHRFLSSGVSLSKRQF